MLLLLSVQQLSISRHNSCESIDLCWDFATDRTNLREVFPSGCIMLCPPSMLELIINRQICVMLQCSEGRTSVRGSF